MATLLGFDYGSHKIGVAVGQTISGTATALQTLHAVNRKPDWRSIDRLVDEWRPDALIVGHPLDTDGSQTDATRPALRFSRQLSARYRIQVHLADERYTSLEARHRLGRKLKAHETYDAVAAQLIIETWLTEHAQANSG